MCAGWCIFTGSNNTRVGVVARACAVYHAVDLLTCMHACIHVHTYMRSKHTYIHTYIDIHTYMRYIRAYMNTHECSNVQTHARKYKQQLLVIELVV